MRSYEWSRQGKKDHFKNDNKGTTQETNHQNVFLNQLPVSAVFPGLDLECDVDSRQANIKKCS